MLAGTSCSPPCGERTDRMSGKLSQLDKAIASIDADIAILQAAKARLVAQQVTKAQVKRPRAVVTPVKPERTA